MRLTALLLVGTMLLSSCATILNGKYQKVTVQTPRDTEILVDGEEPRTKNGLVVLERDLYAKQITLTRDGYKDHHAAMAQIKKSPLYIMSIVPFGILFYPIFYDMGPKAYNYEKILDLSDVEMLAIPERGEEVKQIRLNNIAVDIEDGDIKNRYYYSYKKYRNREESVVPDETASGDINFENTIFTDMLNGILVDKGYVDTTRKVFKDSYLENLFINATIEGITFWDVRSRNTFIVKAEMDIVWEALDLYGEPVFEFRENALSGEMVGQRYGENDELLTNVMRDCLETGLIQFLQTDEMYELLRDKSAADEEDAFTTIEMSAPKDKQKVKSLADAVKAGVTVSTEDGHGSGFFISNDGYIITNHHVVSDNKEITIKTNAGEEHTAEVIRSSRIHDLALLKVEVKDHIAFSLTKGAEAGIATEIYAIGTPTSEEFSQTISRGIVSGVRKVDEQRELIQTDASINSGNSGGALVNKEGQVVGVVSSKLKGFGIEGVAFGIPSDAIFDRLKIDVK